MKDSFTPKIAVIVDEKYMAVTGVVRLLRCERFALRLRNKKSVANCCIFANDVESDPYIKPLADLLFYAHD